MIATPGATIYPTSTWYTSGMAGTLGIRVRRKSDQVDVVARTTSGIVESPAGSGAYTATLVAPTTAGEYELLWDDGALTPGHVALEDLTVAYSLVAAATPSGSDLCTLDDVRSYLVKRSYETSADTLTAGLITRASRAIMRWTGREFAPYTASATRRLQLVPDDADPKTRVVRIGLEAYDLAALTGVTLHPESSSPRVLAVPAEAMIVTDDEGVADEVLLAATVAPFTSTLWASFGFAQADITGSWGFPTIPDDVRAACVETVVTWLRRDVGVYAGGEPTGPDEDVLFRPDSIPPSARAKLHPFRRITVG